MDYAARLSRDRFVIFLFHGVIERQRNPVRNYTRKHVEKGYFIAALRSLLEAGGNSISLDRIASAYRKKETLPPHSFAITFDDGFENNLTVAAPILADMKILATFYVASDFIASNRMSWIDRIEWAIEPASPATMHLPWGRALVFGCRHQAGGARRYQTASQARSRPRAGRHRQRCSSSARPTGDLGLRRSP